MKARAFHVQAVWDEEAAVWVATSDDVPGLVTEADSCEELEAKLKVMIPELLEENGVLPGDGQEVPFYLRTERLAKAGSAGC